MLAGFLSYCRHEPRIRPRIIRLPRGADLKQHLDDLAGEALVLDQRFTSIIRDGWRPKVPAILQCFQLDEALDFPQVGFHNQAVGQAAARHLIEEGLRQLLFIGNRETVSSPWRWKGFHEEAAACDIPVTFFGDGPSQRGQAKIRLSVQQRDLVETLGSFDPPVGVFANDDNRGEWVLEAAREAGLMVPREVAVCCVSSTPVICEWTRPTLSAYQLDHEGQGWLAGKWAHSTLAGEAPSNRLLAPWKFVERDSSPHLRQSDPMIEEAVRCMKDRLAERLTIDEVAASIHTSKRTLERRFRDVLKQSPAGVMRGLRMKKTLLLLEEGSQPLKEVCVNAGWADVSQMGRLVKRQTGLSPAQYRLQAGRG